MENHTNDGQGIDKARQQWSQWREERNDRLREPHGWLSLVGLEWLSQEPSRLRHFPGLWSAVDHDVSVQFTEEDGVTLDGEPMVGTFDFSMERGDQDTSLTDGEGRMAEVASRLGRMCVRTRDPEAPTRTGFTQTDAYDFDPAWIVQGAWRSDSSPWAMRVASAQPGGVANILVRGEADILGKTVIVTGSSDSLQIIFHDQTNGDTTEGWRSAPIEISEDGATATVDFNRAVNFPASFTPYGTCPTPPAANRFDLPITAGEKKNR